MSRIIGTPCGAHSTPSVGSFAVSCAQARQHLQSVRSRLSHSVMDYLAARQLMNATCDISDTPSDERAEALLAMDSELSTFAVEETNLRQARDILVETRNRSKMVAPVYKLPSEILARIFSDAACHCTLYPMAHELVPPILNPISICGVCREWRHIALSYLPLWTHIDLVVGREDSGYKYPSPEMWAKFSYSASLYVNIHQYHSLRRNAEEGGGGEPPYDDHMQSPAPMVAKLGDFLLPLMPQICAMGLVVGSPMEYLPDKLLDWWSRHGTIGRAKIFSVGSKPELPHLEIEALGFNPAIASRKRSFLQSLERIGLYNALPEGQFNWSFGNLVSLLLQGGYYICSVTQTELASVLVSCPKLERFTIADMDVQYSDVLAPNPATLNELRLLNILMSDSEQTIESTLAIINPGPSALCMSICIPSNSKAPHPVLDAVLSFIGRHNVAALHLDHCGDEAYFASQLGALPRVKTLALNRFCFSDIARVDCDEKVNGDVTYTNPSPVDSGPTLWPNLQTLYLRKCALEENHLRRLLLPHSIQSLYMRKCYKGQALRDESLMESQEAEEFVRSLSDLIPKAVHFKRGWKKWPRVSQGESQ